jgi:hypothetical protein
MRANYQCERCGQNIMNIPMSVHHRRPRAMGGTHRTDTNLPSNLMVLCGSGTTGCHGYLESNRTEAKDLGFIVPQWEAPNQVAVKLYLHSWSLLQDDGSIISALAKGAL